MIIAFVLLEVIGYLWYGMIFSKAWVAEMNAIGLKPDMSASAQTTSLAIGAVLILVQVLGLSWLSRKLGATTLAAGASGALAAYVFFALPTQGMEYAYMGFTPTLMAINCGQLLVSYLVAGAVLGGVRVGKAAEAATA